MQNEADYRSSLVSKPLTSLFCFSVNYLIAWKIQFLLCLAKYSVNGNGDYQGTGRAGYWKWFRKGAGLYRCPGKEVEPVYNKITVPTGGEYLVLLSDGSRVRLNSCSSLRYPVVFTGENRTVELEGEAYFEVEKSVHPFFVKTSNVNVRVTGTTFNVSDYADDSR